MGRFSAIIFGVCLGVAGAYVAHEYHFVRARDEVLFVRKRASTWKDIYVDIRGWSQSDWRQHPELSQNLVAAGHGQLIGYSISEGMSQHFRGSFHDRDRPVGPSPRELPHQLPQHNHR